jgi:CHASE2 domain-containing sensor protein
MGHRNQHWAINVVIGLSITLGLQLAEDLRIVVAAQNGANDVAMQGAAAALASNKADPLLPGLVLIDIDEETWRNKLWGNGEPFRAPRAELLALIDYALRQKAHVIVLDVIIEGSEDGWLAGEMNARAAKLKKTNQHILFVRTLREPLEGYRNLLAPELRPSSLDEVIGSNFENMHIAAPYFGVSQDGVLRDWQMWRAGCRQGKGTDQGRWETIPSVQLAVAAAIWADKLPDAKQSESEVKKFPWNDPGPDGSCIIDLTSYGRGDVLTTKFVPDNREVWKWLHDHPALTHVQNLREPEDSRRTLDDRIFFRFRYRQNPSSVRLIPALAILSHTKIEDLAEGSVVVIGQSFEAARDMHATPLGLMPGSMVLINSLASMLDPGLLQPLSIGVEWTVEVLSIFFIAGVLAYSDYFIATLILFFLLLILLILTNYRLLHNGIWMDFALPLIGMFLHRLVAEFEAYIERRYRLRSPRAVTHDHREGEE